MTPVEYLMNLPKISRQDAFERFSFLSGNKLRSPDEIERNLSSMAIGVFVAEVCGDLGPLSFEELESIYLWFHPPKGHWS